MIIAFVFYLALLSSTSLAEDPESSESTNSTQDECESKLYPCSNWIGGNAVLIAYYGITLGYGAKLISDGAESLLDLGVAPALIGGVILPVSGVVPDSMMIFVSGLGPKEVAQDQISVGMGTLAGSTVLLLTVAWGVSLYVGRVDLVSGPTCHGLIADPQYRCSPKFSFTRQGVEVSKEVTMSAIIMLVTMLPYLIVQSADWYFGATLVRVAQPSYVRYSALVTMIIAFVGFCLYIGLQFHVAQQGQETPKMAQHNKHKQQQMMLKAARMFYMASMIKNKQFMGGVSGYANGQAGLETSYYLTQEDKEHLLEKKYFASWKLSAKANKGARATHDSTFNDSVETQEVDSANDNSDSSEDPKWKILSKAVAQLSIGIGLVTLFSDPMCDALTSITNPENPQYIPISSFYISFIITPLCSNASELVSSIAFAMKKEKENLVLTYTQLYSAAIMNNTMCLGVFCALVYFRDLEWYFSAEVTAILFTELVMGVVAIWCAGLYKMIWAIPVISVYFLSLALVAFLEKVLHWG